MLFQGGRGERAAAAMLYLHFRLVYSVAFSLLLRFDEIFSRVQVAVWNSRIYLTCRDRGRTSSQIPSDRVAAY